MPTQAKARTINFELAVPASEETGEGSAKSELRMDESAFRAFHEHTAKPLLGYLLRACGDRLLAEDLWQEAYCRFLTSEAPSMDERRARSYLFQIATNLMRDRWRRPKEEPMAEGGPEAASPDVHLDLRLGMRQAFHRLKLRERQLLWLAYVEGSSHKEIADCTELRAGSVRLLLFRARHKLAELIAQNMREGDPKAAKCK